MANDFSANAEPVSNMENAEGQTNVKKVTIDDVLGKYPAVPTKTTPNTELSPAALAEETFPEVQRPLSLIINYETFREDEPPLEGLTQHAAHLISGNPQWDQMMILHTTALNPNERHEDILAKVAKELAEVDPFEDGQASKFLTMTESLLFEVNCAWESLDFKEDEEKKLQHEIVELKSELQNHRFCTTTYEYSFRPSSKHEPC